MTITVIDLDGEVLVEIPHASRTFAQHLERGDLVRTSEPLVYRLIRQSALLPAKGSPADLAAKWATKHQGG